MNSIHYGQEKSNQNRFTVFLTNIVIIMAITKSIPGFVADVEEIFHILNEDSPHQSITTEG